MRGSGSSSGGILAVTFLQPTVVCRLLCCGCQVLRWLLERMGCAVDAPTADGTTALCWAAWMGQVLPAPRAAHCLLACMCIRVIVCLYSDSTAHPRPVLAAVVRAG